MNRIERLKMVKAMEFICRNINDENYIYAWMSLGVPDGDIEYGDLSSDPEDMDKYAYLIDNDDVFADLMDTFLYAMKKAEEDGGLYCDKVVSHEMKR